jgi:WD repeat-containing protein mio
MVASAFPEKRLLWHPRQDNKFVVGGGSDITLYEWAPDHPEIRHVTSQLDLQFMKVSIIFCRVYPRDSQDI